MTCDEFATQINSRMKDLKQRLERRNANADHWRSYDKLNNLAESIENALPLLGSNMDLLERLIESLDFI